MDVRPGDLVIVEKAGEIIPQVVSVVTSARTAELPRFAMPELCPACGTAAVRTVGEARTHCPNPTCPAQVCAAVLHFSRRYAMDIDHLGESLISQLIDNKLIFDLSYSSYWGGGTFNQISDRDFASFTVKYSF